LNDLDPIRFPDDASVAPQDHPHENELDTRLGIDLHGIVTDDSSDAPGVPEPASALFWGLGMATCAMAFGRSRKDS
jgi:hypothetical protein